MLDCFNLFDLRLILMLLYDSLNLAINASPQGCWGAWFRINEVKSAAEVGLCCMHNAPVHCLLGFLFHKVIAEALDKIGEVGKQSIISFLTFSTPIMLLPKINIIGLCMSRLWDVFRHSVFQSFVQLA